MILVRSIAGNKFIGIFYKTFYMSKSGKVFLGILSFLPFILLIVYLLLFFGMFYNIIIQGDRFDQHELPPAFAGNIILIVVFAILLGLTSLGLKIFYIIHAVNNKYVESNERIVWILVFIFAGMIGFPIYWYMRIWKDPVVTL
jgi:TM2 domain-containing membrane protein YozV